MTGLPQEPHATGCAHRYARPCQRSIPTVKFRHSTELNGATEAAFLFSEPLTANSPNRNPASVTQGLRTHWHRWTLTRRSGFSRLVHGEKSCCE